MALIFCFRYVRKNDRTSLVRPLFRHRPERRAHRIRCVRRHRKFDPLSDDICLFQHFLRSIQFFKPTCPLFTRILFVHAKSSKPTMPRKPDSAIAAPICRCRNYRPGRSFRRQPPPAPLMSRNPPCFRLPWCACLHERPYPGKERRIRVERFKERVLDMGV